MPSNSSNNESTIVWNAIHNAVATIAPPKTKTAKSNDQSAQMKTTKAAASKLNNNTNKKRTASAASIISSSSTAGKATTLSKARKEAEAEKLRQKEKEKRRAKQDEDGLDLLEIGKDEDEQIAAVVSPLVMSNTISLEAGVFIEECIRGILRYHNFLDLTLDVYAELKKRNRAQFASLRIFLYLIFFRLDELGAKGVQTAATNNVADTRAIELMETLTDETSLQKSFIPKWVTLYDDTYVRKVIVDRKIMNQSHWSPLAAYFRTRATLDKTNVEAQSFLVSNNNNNNEQGRRSATPITNNDEETNFYYTDEQAEAAGFDQDRLAQMREMDLRMKTPPKKRNNAGGAGRSSQQQKKFSPTAPKSGSYQRGLNKQQSGAVSSEIRQLEGVRDPLDYPGRDKELQLRKKSPPKEATRVVVEAARGNRFASTLTDEAREQNREKEQSERMKVRDFVATDRPMQISKLLDEQAEREARERQMEFKVPTVEEVRQKLQQHRSQPVKMTQAALLRENALYKKNEEAERQRLDQAERELRSSDDFEQWRTAQHDQAEKEKLTNVMRRKLEAQLIDENAREAKKAHQERNIQQTRELRQQEQEFLEQLREQKEQEAVRNHEQAIELRHQLEVNRLIALENVKEEKLASGAEIRLQNEKGQKEIAVRLELERQRRAELTEQLKKAHSELCARKRAANQAAKDLELKELRALTIDEVREKLETVRQESIDWTEQQRTRILTHKEKEEAKKRALEEQVAKHRKQIVQTKAQVRTVKQQARQTEEERRRQIEDDRVLELQARLQEKREARMKEREEIRQADKSRKISAMLLEADESHVEAKRWNEVERAMERRAIESQKSGVKQNVRSVRLHERESSVRQNNIDHKLVAEADDRADRDAKWVKRLREREEADQVTLELVHRTVQHESSVQRERRVKAATATIAKDFSKVM